MTNTPAKTPRALLAALIIFSAGILGFIANTLVGLGVSGRQQPVSAVQAPVPAAAPATEETREKK